MIALARRLLFIDVPHTDGTALQRPLAPHSDDRIVARPPQDGVTTFEVVGPQTPHKHATLADYRARLGDDVLAALALCAVCRNPWERLAAAYFAPINWLRPTPEGAWIATPPVWRPDVFRRLLDQPPPSTCAMTTAGGARRPIDVLIRHEAYADGVAAFAARFGVDIGDVAPPRLPQVADGAYRDLYDQETRDRVGALYADDVAAFGYRF